MPSAYSVVGPPQLWMLVNEVTAESVILSCSWPNFLCWDLYLNLLTKNRWYCVG